MLFGKEIDFMGKRKIAAIASILAVVISIGSLAINKLNLGLDFTSGSLIELSYTNPVITSEVVASLKAGGYEGAVVVAFGPDRDILVRLPLADEGDTVELARAAATVGDEVVALLRADGENEIDLRRSEYVGAKVGEELAEQGGLGLLVALGIVMIYVAIRFQFKFSVGAVVALGHDVLIILGVFSLFKLTFDLNVLAALLATIGYSLNDTIVVSDRIRENFRLMRKTAPLAMVNISLNQTLSRTLITSTTTLMVLVVMFIFGPETVRGFSVALIIGVIVGTYSSIYVASNIILLMNISREDLMVPVKEGSDLDSIP